MRHIQARLKPLLATHLLSGLLLSTALAANGGEPGLLLRLGDSDARVARQVALFVQEGQAASAFSPPSEQVRATWEGSLKLEARSRLIFTLEGSGSAQLSIDGELLCQEIGTPSERKRLNSGEHAVKVAYQGPASGAAQLRLFWEGREFGKEPVPPGAFTHDPENPLLVQQSQLRNGHRLIEQHQCRSCHGGTGPAAADAPSLSGIGERLETAWIARWITDPQAVRASAHMPKVFTGAGAQQQAADIAAYLGGAPTESSEPEAGLARKGGQIFHDQGCIGCHQLAPRGDAERIGLGGVAHKFRPAALASFLRDPAKHHANSRMPHFGFGAAEAEALAAFLRSLAKPELRPRLETAGDAKRGAQLFLSSGCLNCHQRDALKSTLPLPKPASSASCSALAYTFSASESAAITAAWSKPELPAEVPAEIAQDEFATLRCAACHERDGQQPYRQTYAAEVAHLKVEVPVDEEKPGAHGAQIPHLNHLGQKLRPGWREALFEGQIEPKTRPWLKARMPAFASRAELLTTGFSHAAGLSASPQPPAAPDAERVATGGELVGQSGFLCGTCHGIGDKPAIAVFEGEGPNFRDAGPRLRHEYFRLWMNDPARQWPGTIMPKYASDGVTPLTQYYEGDAARQFDAIYDFIRSLAN